MLVIQSKDVQPAFFETVSDELRAYLRLTRLLPVCG